MDKARIEALALLVGSMRNFADVADSCVITQIANAPVAIRVWADLLAEDLPDLLRIARAVAEAPSFKARGIGHSWEGGGTTTLTIDGVITGIPLLQPVILLRADAAEGGDG